MAIKKTKSLTPKATDAKKKLEQSNSKTKSSTSKQSIRKKTNEFGDDDSF